MSECSRTYNKLWQQGRLAPGPLSSGPCTKRYVDELDGSNELKVIISIN